MSTNKTNITAIKYQLPVIQELKKIGFKSQHRTIKAFFEYAPEFVKDNEDDLIGILLKWFDPDTYNFDKSANNDMDFTFDPILQEAEDRIKRLNNTGNIEFEDYYKVVHPVHKKNPDVLKSIWEKKKVQYAIETHALFLYPKPFGLSQKEANQYTLLNELYRLIIRRFLSVDMFKIPPVYQSSYQTQITAAEKRLDDHLEKQAKSKDKQRSNTIIKQMHEHQLRLLKTLEYEEGFERYRSINERAFHYLEQIYHPPQNKNYINQTTSIEHKEIVIREYLKSQTPEVKRSRNSKGKGIRKAKKTKIKNYIKKHPNKNNSEVARALKVNRKTVAKYRNEDH